MIYSYYPEEEEKKNIFFVLREDFWRMVQGVSLSNFTTCEQSRLYGLSWTWRGSFRQFKKTQIGFFNESSNCVWNECGQRLLLLRKYHNRFCNFKVEAGWFFQGREQESEAGVERSDMAHDDIAILLFQLNMATRLQVLKQA